MSEDKEIISLQPAEARTSAAGERRSATIAPVPADEVFEDEEDDSVVTGRCGPFAAVCEAFGLFFRYPDLTRVVFACALLFASCSMPWIVCLPQLMGTVWGDKAGANNSYLGALRSVVGALACPIFGRWIDRRGHRFGVAVVIFVNVIVTNGVLAIFGINEKGLYAFFVVQTLNAVAGMNSSGCPAVFALIADVLPPEYREIGFGLFFTSIAVGNLTITQIASLLIRAFPSFPTLPLWLTLVLGAIALALLACVQAGGPQEADEEDKGKSIFNLFEPVRLAWRKRTLFYLCIIASCLTFPDIAGLGIGTQYLYHELGLVNSTDTDRLQSATLIFNTYPMIPMIVIYGFVGVLCRRYGPMLIIKLWLPFCALVFAAPAALAVNTDDWTIFFGGTGLMMAFSCFIPVNSLVTHVVPPSRIGEAMSSVASVKMITSIFAPILCGVAWSAIEKSDSDLYWVFWPVAAVLMFAGFPFTFLLEKRVPRDTSATWSTWASARHSRPSAFLSKRQTRPSRGSSPRSSPAAEPFV